jgi:hypothetical protein
MSGHDQAVAPAIALIDRLPGKTIIRVAAGK